MVLSVYTLKSGFRDPHFAQKVGLWISTLLRNIQQFLCESNPLIRIDVDLM